MMTNFDYFEPTGNARLDANLRRHVDKLNMSESARTRAFTSLEKLGESAKKLEKSIEEQKAMLANQEKLLSQIKGEIEVNRKLLAAAKNDITILGRGLEVSPFALQSALAAAGENISWVK